MRVFFFKNHEKVKEDIWSGWYLCSTERGGSWNELPVSCLSFLAFLFRIIEEEVPKKKCIFSNTALPFHQSGQLDPHFRCYHSKKIQDIFEFIFQFIDSQDSKEVPYFNLIQFKAFSTPDASVTWEQICRELSIVKETVRQSHFLGRWDSRFFKLQAIIWLSIILVSHQAIIRVTRRVTAENGAQTLRQDGG